MRNIIIGAVLGAAVIAAGQLLAGSQAQPNLELLNERYAMNADRACLHPAGGWTTIDASSASAASSAQLNDWSKYVIQCDDDAYFATGASAGIAADSGDGWLPAGVHYPFLTDGSIRFVSVLNKNNATDCHYWECK